ncbi:MAG: hypothetical protein AAF191_01135 [Verrucomicrobiota bacterium]
MIAMLGQKRSRLRRGVWGALILSGVILLSGAKEEPGGTSSSPTGADEKEGALSGKTLVLSVESEEFRDGRRSQALRAALKAADAEEAKAVVLAIRSETGYDPELVSAILAEAVKGKTPLYGFVEESALGGGALLAGATDQLYVSPFAVIGGALPDFEGKAEDAASKQVTAVLQARTRSAAEAKGRSAKLVSAFIDPQAHAELLGDVPGKEEDEDGSSERPSVGVLTMTSDEALSPFEGEIALAQGKLASVDELLEKLDLSGTEERYAVVSWQRERDRQKLAVTTSGSGKDSDEEKEKADGDAK